MVVMKQQTRKRKLRPWGWLLLIAVLFILIFSLIIGNQTEEELPEVVTQWRPLVLEEMKKQGLDSRWIDVLMAQLMQESSGLHVDLFQNSESKYGVRGKILSEEESIRQAVFYWLTLMDRAEQLGIRASRENILQSYNMGIGYLDYLDYHDSLTTEELAAGYSEEFLGGGGDPQYVSHVLRYLEMAKRSR